MSGTPPAACHALCVRLDSPATVSGELPPGMRLWTEEVPAAAGAGRRAAEMARPVPVEHGVRAVLLRYADGQADLVLVAHRAVLDVSGLRAFADTLLNGGQPEPPGRTAMSFPDTTVPDWGLGGGHPHGSVRIGLAGAGGDTGSWTAALAATLARYDDQPQSFAVLTDGIAVFPAGTGGAVVAGLVVDLGTQRIGEYLPCQQPPFPLTITVDPDSLRCDHHDVDPVIATQFLRHLAHVHAEMLAAPTRSVRELDLFDDGERDAILALGSVPATQAPRRVHDVFAERVAESPDSPAVSQDGRTVRYRELDHWSDRVAHGLKAFGATDGDLVGVCLERSIELVAVLLGLLKAGCVYVPMDPAHPSDRLAFIAKDANLSRIVAAPGLFPAGQGCPVSTPDELCDAAGQAVTGSPESAVRPEDPAYVIYTSGSTGRPKGCVVPHANVTALLAATVEDFALGQADVWTFFHSSAFDFSVWEIWGCLLTGGRLAVVPYWVARSPGEFRGLLAAERVTVLSQTPSAFTQLLTVDQGEPQDLAIRLVVFGGEPLEPREVLPWFDRYRDCRLVNMYGITETTVHVTARTLTREVVLHGSRNVGKALPGWSVRVLDAAGRVVPVGVVGEIHVGGAGVALGYLARPELTAERFRSDPDSGGRLYRSGDLGRLRPDGSLDHMGRLDNQIKIRGFRIELDEIRGVLLEAPGVTAATVVPRVPDPGDPLNVRLDAYVVGTASGLREHAARLLPDYMMPTTITEVGTLPLTANGKLDIGALPRPGRGHPAGQPGDADDLRNTLLQVWHTVLGVSVGLDDDFFELGGNSLYAVRIAARMRASGLSSVPPRTLYLNPTVRRLALAMEAR